MKKLKDYPGGYFTKFLSGKTNQFIVSILLLFMLSGAQMMAADADSKKNKELKKENSVSSDFQQKKISGTVVDENGTPLPGVNVKVEGTVIGTITDASGKYSVDAPDNAVLVFSFIGYNTAKMPVSGKTTMDVSL
jgi:protocatechuate 3,4-dioxygenase beta subunit